MFLNPNEEKIISTFYKNTYEVFGKKLLLEWDTGSVYAEYDTNFEDIDDDTEEEFYSFAFRILSKTGNPPILVTEDNFFLVDYKNFPNSITLDSVKLN